MRAPVEPAAAAWRLVWPRQPATGVAGTHLGRASGASLEFLDTRDYVPGDDLRHIDWRAYARTDQLRVRVFREEVAPALDVIVDTSASMSITPAKAGATHALRDAFVFWGSAVGACPRVHDSTDFDPVVPLRRDGVRVLLSDFLRPDDPSPLLLRTAVGAALLVVVQVLDPWELSPSAEGAVALLDCESDARLELQLDAATIARYRARLERLCTALASGARKVGGKCARVSAGPLAAMCRDALAPAGILAAS